MVDNESLASWNDGAAKSAILDFVARVTNQGGAVGAPTTSPAIPRAASAIGPNRRLSATSRVATPRGAEPRRGRWARRSTSASCI
jgi:hypothetical protein